MPSTSGDGVQTNYFYAPDVGLPGDITDVQNGKVLLQSVAEEEMGVALGVSQGADLTDPQGTMGFKVKLPILGSDPIGITVRIANLEGEPVNTKASVPVYRAEDLVTYVVKGAIWVKAAKAITAARNDVYVVNNASSTHPLGTLLPDNDSGYAAQLPGAYFERITAVGKIVKVVLL